MLRWLPSWKQELYGFLGYQIEELWQHNPICQVTENHNFGKSNEKGTQVVIGTRFEPVRTHGAARLPGALAGESRRELFTVITGLLLLYT